MDVYGDSLKYVNALYNSMVSCRPTRVRRIRSP